MEMNGRVCLITGATNGIGKVTARELARMGATVVVVGRSEGKALRTVAEIKAETKNPQVDYLLADLSSMDAVRHLADAFRAEYDHLHVLVNNAGAVFLKRYETVDGYERTFALNHLSYFLLTNLLLDMLKASGTPERKARIVNVSSDAHQRRELDFDDLQNERDYNGMRAYGQSKLENIMFTYELARRLEKEGANVTANALHPGFIASGFARNNGLLVRIIMTLMSPFAKSPEEGARTSIYLASSPQVEGVSGRYYAEGEPAKSNAASMVGADWARLWDISEELTGLKEVKTT